MAQDQIQNAQTASQYFEQVNGLLKNEFIIYGETGETGIKLLAPAKVSTLKGSVEDLATADAAEVVHFTKASVLKTSLPDGKAAELAVVNKDGVYDTLVWTTTPQNIKHALRAGVFDSKPIQNKLAKIIAKLGEYNQIVFGRSVEEGFVVKHNVEKLAIVAFTQQCIESLAPLHFSINNFDSSVSPKQNLLTLIKKLETFADQLTAINNGNVDQLIRQINQYKSALITRKNAASREFTQADMEAILSPYANPLDSPDLSLQHFMQAQINTMLNSAVEANYTVSGLFQDTSGLQKIITEAQFISENFSTDNIDYRNAYSAQHVFDFSEDAVDGLVNMDMRRFGFVPTTKVALAKQVAMIERIDANKNFYESADEVRGFFGINWRGNVFAPATWLMNGIKDIIGTFADAGYLAGKAVFDGAKRFSGIKPPPVDFPSGQSWLLKIDLTEKKYAALPATQKLYDINQPVTKIPHQSLLQQLYSGATEIISRYLIDPVVSVSNVIVNEVWHLQTARRILYDSTIGTKKADETAVGLLLQQRTSEKRANEAGNEISQQALIEHYRSLVYKTDLNSYEEVAIQLSARKATLPGAAVIPYHLTPDQPGDFITFIFDDLGRDIVQFFSHEIYRSHPIAGLAFTIAASTAAPMVVPSLLNNVMLASINQNISVPLAKVLIGETSGIVPGISTALLQGKIAYLTMDIFNGRNSLLNLGLKGLLENPVIASVVTTAAVGFGYVLAYDLDIPWLSEKIATETSKASFPYFELGLSGAKIAAILVEGTLNFHHEKDQHLDAHFIDNSVDSMRGEITTAVRKGYLREHGILEADLTQANEDQILTQVEEYCESAKQALKKPELAEQISQLVLTIGQMTGEKDPPYFNGVAPRVTNETSQNELALFLQRRQIRHQIAGLDPKHLSEKDKYVILNYLHQTYKDDPDYVASVRNRLYQDLKLGPFGETFKIITSYPGALIRATIATVRSLGYRAANLFYSRQGNVEQAKVMSDIAENTAIPIREFGRRIKNDLGLVVKGITSIFRTAWGLAAGGLLMPMSIVLAGPPALFSSKTSVGMFGRINRALFAPGRVSQLIDLSIGVMRADAGSKNLTLITQEVDIRENRKILIPTSSPATMAAVNAGQVVPIAQTTPSSLFDMDKSVISLMRTAFIRYPMLRRFMETNPKKLPQLIESIEREIARGGQFNRFYLFINREPQFKRELKIALLEVHAQINQIKDVSIEDRLSRQKMIMDLWQVNNRDPIIEFTKAYEAFTKFKLPQEPTRTGILQVIHKQLTEAQFATQALATTSHGSSLSRSQRVAQLIEQHNCLSLQSVRQIARLQKNIQTIGKHEKLNNIAKADSELPAAKKLLEALEIAHQAARTTAHRLAVNEPIFEALTKLHVTAVPKAAANPLAMQALTSGQLVPQAAAAILNITSPKKSTPTTPVRSDGILNEAAAQVLLVNYIKYALAQAHCDKSALMILKTLEVTELGNGHTADEVKISTRWQTILNDKVTVPSLVGTHSIIPAGVVCEGEPNRNILLSATAPNLKNEETRNYFLLVDSANNAVIKESAGQFIATKKDQLTTITTSQLPPMQTATQTITQNSKATTIPSDEYLLIADKEIQAYLSFNGADTKIGIGGADPQLIAAYVIICEAKGFSHNQKLANFDFDMEMAVNYARSRTGVATGKFIEPLYRNCETHSHYEQLKQKISPNQQKDPIFKMLEKINDGLNLNNKDLQLLRNAVNQTDFSPAVKPQSSSPTNGHRF